MRLRISVVREGGIGGDSDKLREQCEGRGMSGKSDGRRLREKVMNIKMRGGERGVRLSQPCMFFPLTHRRNSPADLIKKQEIMLDTECVS
jgi:hypothetical protein